MRKIIFILTLSSICLGINAQTKVSKANLIGKWSIVAMSVEDFMYYDIEKDSMSIGKAIMDQVMAAGQDSTATAEMLKGKFSSFKETIYTFNDDGSCILVSLQRNDKGTYLIDEAASTITIINSKGVKKNIKASFKNEYLALQIIEPDTSSIPAPIVEFRKAK